MKNLRMAVRMAGVPWWVALALLWAAAASLPAGEKTAYLASGHPDAIALLAPPPLPGSPEQAADLASTVEVFKNAPAADVTEAWDQKKFNVFAFSSAVGPLLAPGKLPRTEAFFLVVQKETERVTDGAKDFYKRPRPYTVEPSLNKGAPEKSFSYPSGHSTRATVFALILAELFPDKRDAILATGRTIGWHRVQIARHYPTDIYAGRVLAQAIVRELKASPEFRRDFAAAAEEIRAAAKPAQN